MGRYDFRPLRVYQTATQLLQSKKGSSPPPWYNVVASVPPAEALVRTQPLPHVQRPRTCRAKKASKLFKPQQITYEEDRLRREFFQDHPWELARPRMVIEDDGRDSYKTDWSLIQQPEQGLSGESVVRRQMHIQQEAPETPKAAAYDQARKEFYAVRLLEDTERRVAREEALWTGAQFGPSMMEIGMKLEDQEYDRWKVWAEEESKRLEQQNAAMYTDTGSGGLEEDEDSEEESDEEDPSEVKPYTTQ